MLEPEIHQRQLDVRFSNGLGSAHKELVPQSVVCVHSSCEPDATYHTPYHAYEIGQTATVQPRKWRHEECPVTDAKEQNSCSSVEGGVAHAQFKVLIILRGASIVGCGRSQGGDEAHEQTVPDLTRQRPMKRVIRRVGWLRDQHN